METLQQSSIHSLHRNRQIYNKVCIHWLNGRCNRHPCPFRHDLLQSTNNNTNRPPRCFQENPNDHSPYPCPPRLRGRLVWTNPNHIPSPMPKSKSEARKSSSSSSSSSVVVESSPDTSTTTKNTAAVATAVVDSSSSDSPISTLLITPLLGHHKAVTGIALPSGSNKLFSASNDETVRVWDCDTGKCVETVNMGAEVGCIIVEGPWIFMGTPNSVKAWNIQTSTGLSLDGPTGQVNALVSTNDPMLFAGIQDGSILAWRFSFEGNCFEAAASLTGHHQSVVALVVSRTRLYSASMDHTIKVWDLLTLQCIQTLTDHTSPVKSLLCWDEYLLSGSLDQTIKVWACKENGDLEVIHTRNEQHGVVALFGMPDAQVKPVLFCSCDDNTVRLYDLPSFKDRGKIYSKDTVRALEMGPDGLFFMGDAAGELKVWKWLVHETEAPSDS